MKPNVSQGTLPVSKSSIRDVTNSPLDLGALGRALLVVLGIAHLLILAALGLHLEGILNALIVVGLLGLDGGSSALLATTAGSGALGGGLLRGALGGSADCRAASVIASLAELGDVLAV